MNNELSPQEIEAEMLADGWDPMMAYVLSGAAFAEPAAARAPTPDAPEHAITRDPPAGKPGG